MDNTSTAAAAKTPTDPPQLSLRDCRDAIGGELFQAKPWVYWTDFLLTFGAGTYCFHQVRGSSLLEPHQGFTGTWQQAFFFVASCLLFYRAAMFIHEVVHQRAAGRLTVFRFVWNLLCGIPFLIADLLSITRTSTIIAAQHYGTRARWRIPAAGSIKRVLVHILFYLSWTFCNPDPAAIIRFMVF